MGGGPSAPAPAPVRYYQTNPPTTTSGHHTSGTSRRLHGKGLSRDMLLFCQCTRWTVRQPRNHFLRRAIYAEGPHFAHSLHVSSPGTRTCHYWCFIAALGATRVFRSLRVRVCCSTTKPLCLGAIHKLCYAFNGRFSNFCLPSHPCNEILTRMTCARNDPPCVRVYVCDRMRELCACSCACMCARRSVSRLEVD